MSWTEKSNDWVWNTVRDFGTPGNVSTETPLLALTAFGTEWAELAFILENLGASPVVFAVEHAESTLPDMERRELLVAAGHQGSILIRDHHALKWGLSAYGDPDGGYPTVSVRWKVVGRRRRAKLGQYIP